MVAEDRQAGPTSWGGYVFNESRAGWYTTSITDRFGNEVDIEYWGVANPEFPEAIHSVAFNRAGGAGWSISTTVWGARDCGDGTSDCAFAGMLKTLTQTGPGASSLTWDYSYDLGNVKATHNGGSVPLLSSVMMPADELGHRATTRFYYGYGGISRGMLTDSVSFPVVVTRIDYPTGASAVYKYSNWIGRSIEKCAPTNRTTKGAGTGTNPTQQCGDECPPDPPDGSGGGADDECTKWPNLPQCYCKAHPMDPGCGCDLSTGYRCCSPLDPSYPWCDGGFGTDPDPCAETYTCSSNLYGWKNGWNAGVVSRTVFPSGAGSGSTAGAPDWSRPHYATSWQREFYADQYGVSAPSKNAFTVLYPDGTKEVSRFKGNPNSSAGNEGLLDQTDYYNAAGTLVRSKKYDWDGFEAARQTSISPFQESGPELKDALKASETTYFTDDQEGATCLDTPVQSTLANAPFQKTVNQSRVGDRWRTTVTTGSYLACRFSRCMDPS